ncbi:uncharacterized protein LOC134684180 [Mytilus trossulus]|uniref:uncharacterized protein LOC134684180 n=1 Tax=Mytilus trossulus TaxID=6551 RepID=UPI003004A966
MAERERDRKCDYRQFKKRNGGRVPCVSIGNSYLDNYNDVKGEITGICFQKVDEGKVNPVIHTDEFLKVDWPCAPTKPAVQHLYLELDYYSVPSQKWILFADVMANLRTALLVQMTPQNNVAPRTLYDGFRKDVWQGAGNNIPYSSATLRSRIADVLPVVRQAGEINTLDIQTILHAMLEGFHSMGEPMMKFFLDNILNVTVFGETENFTVIPPSNPSFNSSIENGVLHCLVYGCHEDQLEYEELRRQNGQARGRVRLRQKILHPKANGFRSRSRSRSPSPAGNNILSDIENTQNRDPNQDIDMTLLLENPGNFLVKPYLLHKYFEPHKPDLVLLKDTIEERQVKIVVEISSYNKYGTHVLFATHLKRSTEQCFQQCMAGLSFNQEEIAGLVVVPDGMKLMVVNKVENENNTFSYIVKETDLVKWNEKNELFGLMQKLIDCSF